MTERIHGMPGDLPSGETILWQGRPAWWPLARRLCHVPAVTAYFAVLTLSDIAITLLDGTPPWPAALAVLPLVAGGMAVVAFLLALAWLVVRSTEYTVTTHRLVMRLGIALPAVLAIPHAAIAHAAIRLDRDGAGDIPIQTKPGHKVALHRVWPHSRPILWPPAAWSPAAWSPAAWSPALWTHAQPMLRSIPRAATVATLLARTLSEAEAGRQRQPALLIAAE